MKHLQLLNLLTILTGFTHTTSVLVNANRQSTSTTIAILEIGSGGTIHRTASTTTSQYTTLRAVSSFWDQLHSNFNNNSNTKSKTRLIPPGLSMVPDMFQKPNGGIFVGLNLVDMTEEELSTMTTIQSILDSKEEDVIGYFDLKGSHMKQLLNHDDDDTSECCVEFGKKLDMSVDQIMNQDETQSSSSNPVVSLRMSQRTKGSGKEADEHIQRMLQNLHQKASKSSENNDSDWTILVHFIIEQTGARTPSLLHHLHPTTTTASMNLNTNRRLEEETYEDANSKNTGSVYYGYGYYDVNGNWYTPYRTIFQMQYFQVTLWSAVGLFAMVVVSMSKMVNMHLMPDTLLHGESAKMSGN